MAHTYMCTTADLCKNFIYSALYICMLFIITLVVQEKYLYPAIFIASLVSRRLIIIHRNCNM